jgi:hypothetical protein
VGKGLTSQFLLQRCVTAILLCQMLIPQEDPRSLAHLFFTLELKQKV